MKLNKARIKKNYRVIISWTYTEWGGAQIYFLSIIKNAPSDWHFTVVLPKNSNDDIKKFFELPNVKLEFFESGYGLLEARGIVNKLKRQCRRIYSEYATFQKLDSLDLKNSVLHIESPPWQSWILLYLLTKRTNVFVTIHNALTENVPNWRKKVWSRRLSFLVKNKNFHLFAANENAVDSLKKYISEKFWDKLILSRACINPREIEKVEQISLEKNNLLLKHELPIDKFIVLCVGQFVDRKGRWIFLESAREISKINKNIFFVWLMPKLPDDEDKQKVENYNLKDSFKMVLSENVGKKREEILQFFRIADVFTLPSLWEGLPIAILEAMALGIPTISTDLNAIPEAVINGKTGLLVKIGDSEALTAAILRLYENGNLRRELGENGRKFVKEKFDESVWAQIALENYKKCLIQQ